MPINKSKILKGREVVDAYREAHRQLHLKSWHKGIPEEHTALLNTMLVELKKQGFNSLNEFWNGSDFLNLQELELDAVFQAEFTEANKNAKRTIDEEGNQVIEDTPEAQLLKREALDRMWR